MVYHAEARRDHFSELLNASVEFKQPSAFQAVKMMMMGLTADLMRGGAPGTLTLSEETHVARKVEAAFRRIE